MGFYIVNAFLSGFIGIYFLFGFIFGILFILFRTVTFFSTWEKDSSREFAGEVLLVN
jgi:hypothetical protein